MRDRRDDAPAEAEAGPTPTLAELEERLADLERLRVQAAGDADAWRAAADELRRDLDARTADLARLRAELQGANAKLRAAEATLEQLSVSLSWRLTAPLRAAAARLRRARRAARPAPHAAIPVQAAPSADPASAPVANIARAVAESGVFDRAFYLARYPDVAASGQDPVLHYLAEGAAQGNDPGPAFSTTRYLELNPDVAAAGLNPLVHYLSHGRAEGRVAPAAVTAPDAAPADPLPRLPRPARTTTETPRILIVDRQVPTPDRDSGSARMQAILELLAELNWRVSFVSHETSPRPDEERALAHHGVEVLRGPDAARAHLAEHGPACRLAWLSRPPVAELYTAMVRAHAVTAELLYDTVDLHSVRHLRAFELSGDPEERRLAEHFRTLETFAITAADRVIAITPTEQRTIEERWPGTRTVLLPNIHDVRLTGAPFREREGLLFIGGYAHLPNVDAMRWFTREILPLARREWPEVRLRMVGAGMPDELRALASEAVDAVGWVRDAAPEFARARVFVCPLRYGAGMKGKVGQAMSLGTPVVTTTIGAEGMQLTPGVHALVEDDPAAFAAALVRLHRDEALWSAVRNAAAEHVEAHFSRAAARRTLAALLATVPARTVRPGDPS